MSDFWLSTLLLLLGALQTILHKILPAHLKEYYKVFYSQNFKLAFSLTMMMCFHWKFRDGGIQNRHNGYVSRYDSQVSDWRNFSQETCCECSSSSASGASQQANCSGTPAAKPEERCVLCRYVTGFTNCHFLTAYFYFLIWNEYDMHLLHCWGKHRLANYQRFDVS